MTAREARDFFAQHCDGVHDDWEIEIDPRSVPCQWSVCQMATIRPPAATRKYDETRKLVFIDAVLER